MNMRTRGWVVAASAALVLAAGCAKEAAPAVNNTSPAQTTASSADLEKTGGLKLPLTQTPVTYKFSIIERADAAVKNDWPVMKELEKRTGVKIEFVPLPQSSASEKNKIYLATGEVPDISVQSAADGQKFGPQGVFLKLNDLIDKYAPNIKKMFAENPDGKVIAASPEDGGIYSLPALTSGAFSFNYAWMARRDLMKEYNIKSPTTMDDFYQMLKTFKQKNPDSYPLTVRLIDGSPGLYRQMAIQFMGIDASYGIGWDAKQNKYRTVVDDPNFKSMLEFLNKLYSEGLLDPEFVANNVNQWEQKLLSGKSFVTFDFAVRADQFTDKAVKADAGTKFDMFAFAPFAAPSGQRAVTGNTGRFDSSNSVALSAKIKQPEIAIQYLDYLYSPEGKTLLGYGIEGETYTMKDGKPEMAEKFRNAQGVPMLRKDYGAFYDGLTRARVPDPTPITSRVQEMNDLYKPFVIPTARVLPKNQQEQDTITQKMPNVQKFWEEELPKFIMGRTPINDDTLAKFKAQYIKFGAEDIVGIYNAEYDRAYKGK